MTLLWLTSVKMSISTVKSSNSSEIIKKNRKVPWNFEKFVNFCEIPWNFEKIREIPWNVKFVKHSVEIYELICHSDFTWNQCWQICTFKNCNFDNLGDSEFWFLANFSFKNCKNYSKTRFRGAKTVKIADFETPKSPRFDFT